MLDTNVGGVFNVTRAVVPHMISRRAGKIVNVSSVSGEKGGRGQTNYAASKGAINAFTRALAVELAPRRINVNCVAPGVIETEMSQDIRERAGDEVQRAHPAAALRHSRRTSRTRCGSSPRGTPTTSPARCCTSTAASRWSDRDDTEEDHQGRDRRGLPEGRADDRRRARRATSSDVKLDVSLIEGLDAESIDFLDLVFRLERAFKVKIPRGKIVEDARGDLPEAEFEQKGLVTEAGLQQLREFLSEVPAERFQSPIKVRTSRGSSRPRRSASWWCARSAPRKALAERRSDAARMADRFSAFSFVDRITELEPGSRAAGRYAVPAHLPRFPPASSPRRSASSPRGSSMSQLGFRRRPVAGLAGETLFFGAVAAGRQASSSRSRSRPATRTRSPTAARPRVDGDPVLELRHCVGPMLPMEEFDAPEAMRARLRGARADRARRRDASAALAAACA